MGLVEITMADRRDKFQLHYSSDCKPVGISIQHRLCGKGASAFPVRVFSIRPHDRYFLRMKCIEIGSSVMAARSAQIRILRRYRHCRSVPVVEGNKVFSSFAVRVVMHPDCNPEVKGVVYKVRKELVSRADAG